MSTNLDELRLIEAIYRSMGSLFALYGDKNPTAKDAAGPIQLEDSRALLIGDIGALQQLWSAAGKSAAVKVPPSTLQSDWTRLSAQLVRLHGRITVWTSWQRRAAMLLAAEQRLMRKLQLLMKQSPELRSQTLETVLSNVRQRISLLQTFRRRILQRSENIDANYRINRDILNSSRG